MFSRIILKPANSKYTPENAKKQCTLVPSFSFFRHLAHPLQSLLDFSSFFPFIPSD